MEPYQERVVEEKNDLDGKIARLARFLNSGVLDTMSIEEVDILDEQLTYMQLYNGVLSKRISMFRKDEG